MFLFGVIFTKSLPLTFRVFCSVWISTTLTPFQVISLLIFPSKLLLSPLKSFCSVLCTFLLFLFCLEGCFDLCSALEYHPGVLAYHVNQLMDEMKTLRESQQRGFRTSIFLSLWHHRILSIENDSKWEQMHQLQGRCLPRHSPAFQCLAFSEYDP